MTTNQAKSIDGYLEYIGEDSGCRLYTINQDRRVVLHLDYEPQGVDIKYLPEVMKNYAAASGADKICVRLPGHAAPLFMEQGYQVEASIPGYYLVGEPMLFLAHHLSARRALASRGQQQEGFHLEIQYRSGQQSPFLGGNFLEEVVSSEQKKEALNFYLANSLSLERQDLEPFTADEVPVLAARQENKIKAVGAMLTEGSGRVARIQCLTTTDGEEAAISQALFNQLWSLAEQKGASLMYSLTSPRDKLVNQVLPGIGFSFRGKLGADTISNGVYGDRYVWSRLIN